MYFEEQSMSGTRGASLQTSQDDRARVSAQRKVADAILLERAAAVLERRIAFRSFPHFIIRRRLLSLAWHLRNEAGREWGRQEGQDAQR